MQSDGIAVEQADEDLMVVVVEGEHDIYTAPVLRERLGRAAEGARGLVVDLTATTFLDSTVLGVLLDARRRAHEAGAGFAVCLGEEVHPGVQRIFDVTGLVPVLPVVRGREAALSSAGGAAAREQA